MIARSLTDRTWVAKGTRDNSTTAIFVVGFKADGRFAVVETNEDGKVAGKTEGTYTNANGTLTLSSGGQVLQQGTVTWNSDGFVLTTKDGQQITHVAADQTVGS